MTGKTNLLAALALPRYAPPTRLACSVFRRVLSCTVPLSSLSHCWSPSPSVSPSAFLPLLCLCLQTPPLHSLDASRSSLPTGTEKGTYYALDLGGTNFRVLSLTLPGDGTVASILTLPFRIPSIKCTAEELYGFIAGSITQFLKVYPPAAADASSVQLGFTFSFPCLQSSLNSATLIKWTKEFEVSGCVGQDPAKQLMKALDVQDGVEDGKLSVGGFNGFNLFHIAALCNDTVGTLMAKVRGGERQ